MTSFQPNPGDPLTLFGESFSVMPHPSVSDMSYIQEARKAHVVQLKKGANGGQSLFNFNDLFALKIFKPAFRNVEIEVNTQSLEVYKSLPGLEVANRRCITKKACLDIVRQHADLEFAVLMPWVRGHTWFDIVYANTSVTKAQSLQFARSTARILAALESKGVAHCDIAAGNVMLDIQNGEVWLIDIEDIYAPGMPKPAAISLGTDGYAHKTKAGQWSLEGDRFSGAIILAEMICWHNDSFRKKADSEHYFRLDELQKPDADSYKLMQQILASISPDLARLMDQAWKSETLAECPKLAEWLAALEPVTLPLGVDAWVPIKPPPPPPPAQFLYTPIPIPPSQPTFVSFINAQPAPQPPMLLIMSPPTNGTFTLRCSLTIDGQNLEYEVEETTDRLFSQHQLIQMCLVTNSALEVHNKPPGSYFYRARAKVSGGPWSRWSKVLPIEVV